MTFPASPPLYHHDLLDAASRVGQIELSFGYVFRNKMLCIEALKSSGAYSPLYFQGHILPIANNNRLALIGDRALSMTVCEIWWATGDAPRECVKMERCTVTRVALAQKGKSMGIDALVLVHENLDVAHPNKVAETFEAILGAIYVDSNFSLRRLKQIIRKIGLIQNEYPRQPDEVKEKI